MVLGHFQIQTWTGGLVILTANVASGFDRRAGAARWRDRRDCVRGAALAAVQLGLSWQLASARGTDRPFLERTAFTIRIRLYTGLKWYCRDSCASYGSGRKTHTGLASRPGDMRLLCTSEQFR